MKSRVVALAVGLLISATVLAGLETATYINELVTTNPVGATDPKSQGDDHLRLIKSTLKNTFPNLTGAVTLTHTQINNAAVKTELNDFTNRQRITGSASTPASGGGFELSFASGTTSVIDSFNRTTALFLPLNINSSAINFGGGVSSITINGGALDLTDITATAAQINQTTLLTASTYTPSAFNAINCGVTPGKHFYTRVGNIVTVTGRSAINITAGSGTSTSFELSLPVASNFTGSDDLAGDGSNDDTGAETIRIQANTGNDRAAPFFSAISTGLGTLFYTFSYEVK